MTISLWCVLVALLAPYLLSVLARLGVSKTNSIVRYHAILLTKTLLLVFNPENSDRAALLS